MLCCDQNQVPGILQHDSVLWGSNPGPQRRAGSSSTTFRLCHFDGGWESEGISAMVPSGGNRIDMYDDPEFTYDLTYDRTSFVDHGAVVWGIVLMVGEWPPLDDAQRQINLRFTEFEMQASKAVSEGSIDVYDASSLMTCQPLCHMYMSTEPALV